MSNDVGISVVENPDGTWCWQLHLKKDKPQSWMCGIAKTYADAETAAASAKARFEIGNSGKESRDD
jgi:hypothetical protein